MDTDTHFQLRLARSEIESREKSFAVLKETHARQCELLVEQQLKIDELNNELTLLKRKCDQSTLNEDRASQKYVLIRKELDNCFSTITSLKSENAFLKQELAQYRGDASMSMQSFADQSANLSVMDATANQSGNQSGNQSVNGERSQKNWRMRYLNLQREMSIIANELELNQPKIAKLNSDFLLLKKESTDLQQQLAVQKDQNSLLKQELATSKQLGRDFQQINQKNQQKISDFRRQIICLLSEAQIQRKLTPEEQDLVYSLRLEMNNESSSEKKTSDSKQSTEGDGNELISKHLLVFNNVSSLQFQNEQLLHACRDLASELDKNINKSEIDDAYNALNVANSKAKELKTELDSRNQYIIEVEDISKRKDIEIETLKSQLLDSEQRLQRFLDNASTINIPEVPDSLKQEPTQKLLIENRQQNDGAQESALSQIAVLTAENNELKLSNSNLNLRIQNSENINSELKQVNENLRVEKLKLEARIEAEQKILEEIRNIPNIVNTSGNSALHVEIQNLQAELESSREETAQCKITISSLELRLSQLQDENSTLSANLSMNAGLIEQMRQQDNSESLKMKIESLETDIQAKEQKLQEFEATIKANESRMSDFQNRDEELVEQVNALEDKLVQQREELHQELQTQLRDTKVKLQADAKAEFDSKLNEIMREHEKELETERSHRYKLQEELETTLKNGVSRDQPKEVPLASELTPGELRELFVNLSSEEHILKLEKDVLKTEELRVKDLIKKKLDEAQIAAEEKSAKKMNMKYKLLNQKLANLGSKNEELLAKIEDLVQRNRRLKGGLPEIDEKSSKDEVTQANQTQESNSFVSPENRQPEPTSSSEISATEPNYALDTSFNQSATQSSPQNAAPTFPFSFPNAFSQSAFNVQPSPSAFFNPSGLALATSSSSTSFPMLSSSVGTGNEDNTLKRTADENSDSDSKKKKTDS